MIRAAGNRRMCGGRSHLFKRKKVERGETAQEWSWHTLSGPQTCRIDILLPFHELGLPNIDPNNDKGSY